MSDSEPEPQIKDDNDNQSGEESPFITKRQKMKRRRLSNSSASVSVSQSNSEKSIKKESHIKPNVNSSEDEDYSAGQSDSSYNHHKNKKDKKLLTHKRNRDKKKKKKTAPVGNVSKYFDIQAEEDSQDESLDESGAEITKEQQKKLEKQHYKEYQQNHAKMTRINDINEEELIDRYKDFDHEKIDYNPNDEIEHHGLQPSISDPKLWMIKCKIGRERETLENLFHKYFHYNKEKDSMQLKIFSAFSFDSLKGYIYIEAYKEANVREAIIGISTLRENSLKIVPINEMTAVFEFDKIQKINIKPKQWVRIKNGMYEGDLAQVLNIEDPINKIYIRIIPRIADQSGGTPIKENVSEYNKKLKKNIKPRQKLFNPKHYNNIESKTSTLFGNHITWNKQMFKDGFLIKIVKAKSLLTEQIVPTIEELKIFDLTRFNKEDRDEEINPSTTDLDYLMNAIQDTEIMKHSKFTKGDRVKLIEGGFNGITGQVISHINQTVQLTANVEGIGNEILELPETYLIKQFLPGEIVQVINGPNIGKQGCIVKIEENDDTAIIFSESTKSHYKISTSDIVYTSQISHETDQNPFYKIGDLVKINNTNSTCYVLDVLKYSLKIIDTRNEIKNVTIRDVFKLPSNRMNGIDSKKNPVTKDDTVKVITGNYKGVKGIIKNIYKNFVFLYNNDYMTSNGIFVDLCENIEILGSELLVDSEGTKGRVNQRFIPENIKSLIGKTVKIISGVRKGYYGFVKDVTDKMAYVELSSLNKTIRVELTMIQDMLNENTIASRYDTITPRTMIQPKTPAYYPQSPHPNNSGQSPKWNPNATPNYFPTMSPNPKWN